MAIDIKCLLSCIMLQFHFNLQQQYKYNKHCKLLVFPHCDSNTLWSDGQSPKPILTRLTFSDLEKFKVVNMCSNSQ